MFDLLDPAEDVRLTANTRRRTGRSDDLWIQPGTGVTLTSKDGAAIPQGYYDGSGKAKIDAASATALVAGNIKQGVSILGVTGTYAGEAAKLQTKSVTPSTKAQTVTADTGYDALSSVSVAAIPYTEATNAAGGTTVTIAGA